MPLEMSKKDRIDVASAPIPFEGDISEEKTSIKTIRVQDQKLTVAERKNQIYATMDAVLVSLEENLVSNISALTAKEQLMFWKDLMEYRMPKMSRVESQVEVTKNVIRVLNEIEVPSADVVSFVEEDLDDEAFLDSL